MPEQDQQYDDRDRDAEQPKKYCGHSRSSKVVIDATINGLFRAAQLVALSRQRISALFAPSVAWVQRCNHIGQARNLRCPASTAVDAVGITVPNIQRAAGLSAKTSRAGANIITLYDGRCPVDLNGFWRFDLVRGFSRDPARGACLLTAVSWLVEGKRSDRPKCVCSLLAQFGRHGNDILDYTDRQRLKAFIYRLGGSRDASAMDRRARILVNSLMRGMWENSLAGGRDRRVTFFAWMRALLYLRVGLNSTALHAVLVAFERRYRRGCADHRSRLVDILCQAFDAALGAGREGEMDPLRAATSMDSYQRLSGAVPSIPSGNLEITDMRH
jgi:hypothetical protein